METKESEPDAADNSYGEFKSNINDRLNELL